MSQKRNSFHDCCNHGNVKLSNDVAFPHDLQNLFEAENEMSLKFFKHIRLYNSIFSFASFNANIVDFSNRRPGPYCFKIQGSIYYQFNTSLHPENNCNPSYGQLFFINADQAVQYRMALNSEIENDIVKLIKKTMRDHNIFAHSYEMMCEELLKVENSSDELQLLFSLKGNTDKRRYNFQRSNEVAAVFSTTADGEIPDAYVVVRNKNTKELQTVSTLNPNVEPWVYPLFHPYGTQRWHTNMLKEDGKKKFLKQLILNIKLLFVTNLIQL